MKISTPNMLLMLAVVCFLISITLMAKSCSKLSNQIEKHGLKSIVEEIWEGKKN